MSFKDNTLIGILQSLVADEFLAWTSYYFYEIISQGKALNYTNKIFEENGKDELEDHYKKLVTWMQSNHIPIPTGLDGMMNICNTPYKIYGDPTSSSLLVDQMIKAEKEAIDAYVQAMKEPAITIYPDLVVMLGEICNDEREHLKNLEDVKSNIDKYGTNRSMDPNVINFTERIKKSFSSKWYVEWEDNEEDGIAEFDDKKSADDWVKSRESDSGYSSGFEVTKGPYQK